MIDQTLDSALEAGIRPLVTGTPWRALIGKISRVPFWGPSADRRLRLNNPLPVELRFDSNQSSRQRMPRRLARQQSREAP